MDEFVSLELLRREYYMGLTQLQRWEWWKGAMGPQRRFPRACQHEVEANHWSNAAQWWLEESEHLTFIHNSQEQGHHQHMAQLHLRCTQVAIAYRASTSRNPPPAAHIAASLSEAGRPLGFLLDLARVLLGEQVRPALASQTLPVLVVDREYNEGLVLSLTLDRVEGGSGVLYLHPDQAFVFRDQEFEQAEENAQEAVKHLGLWPPEHQDDVRWSLTRSEGGRLPTLTGPSAGGAFALGLAKLLSQPR